MRYLLLISTLSTSLLFSAASWAEWTYVAEGVHGTKYYVDFERIRKVNGLVYYWSLSDYLEPIDLKIPSSNGTMSRKMYHKADCETMREMGLSVSRYKLPMAEGTATGTYTPHPQWRYVQPDSSSETILEAVCAH